jgi:hypothetical protein
MQVEQNKESFLDFCGLPPIGQKQRRPMDGAQFHRSRVGNAGGGLERNKNASSTKRDVVMKFYGLPPIGQKQRRPMDGAQFHSPRVGEASGRLYRNVDAKGHFSQENDPSHDLQSAALESKPL